VACSAQSAVQPVLQSLNAQIAVTSLKKAQHQSSALNAVQNLNNALYCFFYNSSEVAAPAQFTCYGFSPLAVQWEVTGVFLSLGSEGGYGDENDHRNTFREHAHYRYGRV